MTYNTQIKCIKTQQHSTAYKTNISKFANDIRYLLIRQVLWMPDFRNSI